MPAGSLTRCGKGLYGGDGPNGAPEPQNPNLFPMGDGFGFILYLDNINADRGLAIKEPVFTTIERRQDGKFTVKTCAGRY